MTGLEDVIKEWSSEVIERIKFNLDATGTTASGKTKESLEMIWTKEGFAIVGRKYFRGVEEGRTPGGAPRNFVGILEKWIKDKGLTRPSEFKTDRSWAGAIAYNITHFGSRLYRDGGRDDIYTVVIDEELPKLFEQMEGKVTQTIIKDLNFN